MRTRSWISAALLTTVLLSQFSLDLALPALADPVNVAGKQAFDVQLGVGKTSAKQRASMIEKNIDNALVASTNRSPNSVAIIYVNKQPILTLGGFYVASIDDTTAKRLGLTSGSLANRWASGLKTALSDRVAVNRYVYQLTGSANVGQAGTTTTQSGSYPYYRRGAVIYVPAGMTLPVVLNNSISSEFAKSGDPVQATLAQPINLGDRQIPAHSLLLGQVTESVPGARASHSGQLGLKFNSLQTPDGSNTPITAHIIGGLAKYEEVGGSASDQFHGETTGHKIEDAAVRGAIGAGSGALVGTVIGAIASHGYGTGRGALAGVTIGSALGVADSLLLRKGSNVTVQSGQALTLQLDAPAQITAPVY